MAAPLMVIAAIAALGLLYVVVPMAMDAYARYRGTHVVICPETQSTATLEFDSTRAALLAVTGSKNVRVANCSRWPERHLCGQECLRQV
jgi:hypothetical protein